MTVYQFTVTRLDDSIEEYSVDAEGTLEAIEAGFDIQLASEDDYTAPDGTVIPSIATFAEVAIDGGDEIAMETPLQIWKLTITLASGRQIVRWYNSEVTPPPTGFWKLHYAVAYDPPATLSYNGKKKHYVNTAQITEFTCELIHEG